MHRVKIEAPETIMLAFRSDHHSNKINQLYSDYRNLNGNNNPPPPHTRARARARAKELK